MSKRESPPPLPLAASPLFPVSRCRRASPPLLFENFSIQSRQNNNNRRNSAEETRPTGPAINTKARDFEAIHSAADAPRGASAHPQVGDITRRDIADEAGAAISATVKATRPAGTRATAARSGSWRTDRDLGTRKTLGARHHCRVCHPKARPGSRRLFSLPRCSAQKRVPCHSQSTTSEIAAASAPAESREGRLAVNTPRNSNSHSVRIAFGVGGAGQRDPSCHEG